MRLYLLGTKTGSAYKGQRLTRRLKWWVERRLYGFDETETWSLDFRMVQVLYERVRLFKKYASKHVHMDHEVTVRGVTHTQEEWIDMLLLLMKQYLNNDFDYKKEGFRVEHDTKNMIWAIWSELHETMWW